MPIAQLIEVSKVYRRSESGISALNKVSLNANLGELILLLGPSGSGKTTMLTVLAGLQKPSSGEVFIFNRKIEDYTSKELQKLRATRIGFIFQTFYLLEALTVIENIMLVMKFGGVSHKDARIRAQSYLVRFGVDHLKNAWPAEISHGEKQRVAVARALANEAELIIADEPTASLATAQGMQIVQFLKESVKSEKRCVIIASHDERISQYADRVIYLRDGTLVGNE